MFHVDVLVVFDIFLFLGWMNYVLENYVISARGEICTRQDRTIAMIKRSTVYISLVFLIFLFHGVNNLIIIHQDNVPLFFDEIGFYNLSVSYWRHLFSLPQVSRIFHHFHSISNFYPPLFFITRLPFYALWGVSEDVSVLANLPFLFIFIVAVYLIGKYIAGPKTGLLAAFLAASYPAVYGFSRTNFMTIAVAGSVALSLYLLLRSEDFSNRGYSLLFGVALGLSLLLKWLCVIYLVPGVLLCAAQSFRAVTGRGRGRIALNLFLAAMAGILLALPWYLPNIKNIIPMLFSAGYDNPYWSNYLLYFRQNPFRLNILRYMMVSEQYQLYTCYTLLFLYFFFKYLISSNNRHKHIILTSFFIPYLIFSFAIIEPYSGELQPRYLVPLYALVALITAWGVLDIKKTFLRRVAVVFLIVLGLAQFFWVSYAGKKNNFYSRQDFIGRMSRGVLAAKEVDWKIEEISAAISNNRVSGKPNFLIIPHTPLTSALVSRLGLRNNTNLLFPLNITFDSASHIAQLERQATEFIDSSDFVLVQDKGLLTYNNAQWIKDGIQLIISRFEKRKEEFVLARRFHVDIDEQGVGLLLYKKRGLESGPVSESPPEGQGVLVSALDFSQGNLTYSPKFGLLIDGGISPASASYDVDLPQDADYELWVCYATMQDRPIDIYFDNVLKMSGALSSFTAGWSWSDARWFKQIEIKDAKKGRHSLRLTAQKTPFVHIQALKFVLLKTQQQQNNEKDRP